MFKALLFGLSVIVSAVSSHHVVRAVAHLRGEGIGGSVTFTEQADGRVRVAGAVAGLPPGNYGFHVHELGDPSDGCLAAGAHFNPDAATHGGPEHDVRHVGDLGNLAFDADDTARVDFVDRLVALNGRYGVVGRTLVLHAGEDDLGLGEHDDSPTTGNAGARVACGVIGILAEEVSAAHPLARPIFWLPFTLLSVLARMYY